MPAGRCRRPGCRRRDQTGSGAPAGPPRKDEATDKWKRRVGDDVIEQIVASITPPWPANENRDDAQQRRRRAAEEDHREDERQEAARDLDLAGRMFSGQIAENREAEQDPEQRRIPVAPGHLAQRQPPRRRAAPAPKNDLRCGSVFCHGGPCDGAYYPATFTWVPRTAPITCSGSRHSSLQLKTLEPQGRSARPLDGLPAPCSALRGPRTQRSSPQNQERRQVCAFCIKMSDAMSAHLI